MSQQQELCLNKKIQQKQIVVLLLSLCIDINVLFIKKMDLGCLKSDRFAPDIVAFWCSCIFSEFYSSSIPLHLLNPRILISVIHSAISNTNKICIKRVSNACPRTTNITALSTGWKFICRKTSYFWWNAFQYINLLG